jgi:hypothetical protein
MQCSTSCGGYYVLGELILNKSFQIEVIAEIITFLLFVHIQSFEDTATETEKKFFF